MDLRLGVEYEIKSLLHKKLLNVISTGFHWISLCLGQSVVAFLMWPHLGVLKWTKYWGKLRMVDSNMRRCIITGRNLDEAFNSRRPWRKREKQSTFIYLWLLPLFTDLILITFQFSSGIFSLGQSPFGSIQLVKTANGQYFISQFQYNSTFGLGLGC